MTSEMIFFYIFVEEAMSIDKHLVQERGELHYKAGKPLMTGFVASLISPKITF